MLLSAAPLLHALPAKRLPDDVNGKIPVLRQRPDGGATDVRPVALASVVREHRVDDPQPATAVEDRAAAAAIEVVSGRVPVR